jgi:hypothetical protein
MKFTLIVSSLLAASSSAFSVDKMRQMSNKPVVSEDASRRSLLLNSGIAAAALVGASRPAMADDEIKIDVFNGLIFNYRGNGFNGLDASTLDEPSIPFLEFGARLQKGEVEFVEFLAPDGDAAYATFKTDGEAEAPIRIGEGFPIEQHDGYSSPAFVVRALKNYNVSYKFTVPGLEKYK